MRARCFFSYCWTNAPMDLILLLQKRIEDNEYTNIEVILDKKSFRVTEDLRKSENKLIDCDTTVVFYTPEYKKAIEKADIESGVYREYLKIREILRNEENKVVLVLLRGDKYLSVPSDLKYRHYIDISNIELLEKKNKKVVKNSDKSTINNLASLIINKTEKLYDARNDKFDSNDQKIDELLFLTTANDKLPKECMVELDIYSSIMSQRNYLIIGRKGSGKSTLVEVIKRFDPMRFSEKYKAIRPIFAETFRMEYLFKIINKYKLDFEILKVSKIINLFWEAYISLNSIYIVCIEEKHNNIQDDRKFIIRRVSLYIMQKLKIKDLEEEGVPEAIFTVCVELLDKFLNENILYFSSPEDDVFLSSIIANFSTKNILATFFGSKMLSDITYVLNKCTKKIMIALDGFDTDSEDFRRTTYYLFSSSVYEENQEAKRRLEFEGLFFRCLVNVVYEIKRSLKPIFKLLDFCVILPKDRYDHIKAIDRDIDKKNIASLEWSAYNLMKLIVLRFENIFNISPVDMNIRQRYLNIMNVYFPAIPSFVHIEIDGIVKEIDLFVYILRLTFWRPRDILVYYSKLYELSEANKKDKIMRVIDDETIKDKLNKKTADIIEKQFIGEYKNVFENIENVLHSFTESTIVINPKEFSNKLACIEFITRLNFENKLLDKISLLYELGVIGLYINNDIMSKRGIKTNSCFVFNEGLAPLDLIKTNFNFEDNRIKFVFNPIFFKYLALQPNTSDLICNFSWEYIVNNHQRR